MFAELIGANEIPACPEARIIARDSKNARLRTISRALQWISASYALEAAAAPRIPGSIVITATIDTRAT